jgi:hypothetical protein
MERGTELQAAERDRTVKQDGKGDAVQFLLASQQFSTRSCARCAGLLVHEWRHDVPAEDNMFLRCVQCGHRIDPLILRNRILPRSKVSTHGRYGVNAL